MSIEVVVILRDAVTGEKKQIAHMDIWNDASGDSRVGNYHVIAGWTYMDGRSRSAEADVRGFDRSKSCLALLQHCLDELALVMREKP